MGNSPAPQRRQIGDKYEIGLTDELDSSGCLDINNLPSNDPIVLFQKWYKEADEYDEVKMVNTATLSTASRSGRTSSRIVGINRFDKNGFRFATNCNSLKAKNMDENPFASLLFYWECMGRMVKIDGRVVKLSADEMKKCWMGFSREAQIMHTASNQDEPIKSPKDIFARKGELEMRYPDSKPIPVSPDWCLYNLIPEVVEFYECGCVFMDRTRFRHLRAGEIIDGVLLHKGHDGWVIETVSP
jgi:pyridoxine/pyridoxamine 5'-phosphate oxidase